MFKHRLISSEDLEAEFQGASALTHNETGLAFDAVSGNYFNGAKDLPTYPAI